MKRIAILGSTGSIGKNAIKVIEHLHDELSVVALAARSNIDVLEEQIRQHKPSIVGVYDSAAAKELAERVVDIEVDIIPGMEGLHAVAAFADADLVLSSISGTMGLSPTVAAIDAGKDVALANKEALVSGGALVMEKVKQNGVNLIPVDSEHSALFQCLQGEQQKTVNRLILTASGGPFRNKKREDLLEITAKDALAHPTWSMGPKVTIDSSTLMNKGLEVIEAHWLFDIPPEKIDVVVHPQSIIHSMVEFCDRSIMAQLGETTMITPIQYALTYPNRREGMLENFDFMQYPRFDFLQPDKKTFRCLALAFQALKTGGSLPCYMNAANEILVERFIKGQLGWCDIAERLESLMNRHQVHGVKSIEDVYAVDEEARGQAQCI